MITSLEIENFKAIGSPGICLEVSPITLLFGPNSAGKSTILQALQYLRQLVLYEPVDVDRTDAGSGRMDLGGFRRLVHKRELDRTIRIRVNHTRKCWQDFWLWQNFVEPFFSPETTTPMSESILGELVDSLGMEVEVKWSRNHERPFVSSYKVYLNNQLIVTITSDPDKNFIIPEFGRFETAFDAVLKGNQYEENLRGIIQDMDQYALAPENATIGNAMGMFTNPERRVIPDPNAKEASWIVPQFNQLDEMGEGHRVEIFRILSALLIGPSYLTTRELTGMLHIGPIRAIPPRDFSQSISDPHMHWYDGLGAWNFLFRAGESFLKEAGDWLGRKDRLGTGYQLRLQRYFELNDNVMMSRILSGEDIEVLDDLKRQIQTTPKHERLVFEEEASGLDLAPSEVGTGLSQLVPLVVGALDPYRRILAIEQPELHVHPAVQVAIGDLLIRGIMSDFDEDQEHAIDSPPIMLIETHSEHLMLRLLRRIEESTDGFHPVHLKPLRPEDVSVNYVYTNPDTRQLEVKRLRIDGRGEFIDEWPHGFFGERGDELFR